MDEAIYRLCAWVHPATVMIRIDSECESYNNYLSLVLFLSRMKLAFCDCKTKFSGSPSDRA